MAKNKNIVSLGVGDIYLGLLEVGYAQGDVTLSIAKELLDFVPNGEKSAIKYFRVGEKVQIKFPFAQLDCALLKLAMGVTTAVLSTSSFPAYDPSSFSVTAGDSFDVQHFGGEDLCLEQAVRFEHTFPGGTKKLIVVLYNAVCISDFSVDFKKKEIIVPEMTWEALADPDRSKGDKIGFIAITVKQT